MSNKIHVQKNENEGEKNALVSQKQRNTVF